MSGGYSKCDVLSFIACLRSCMMAEFFEYSNLVEYVLNRTVRCPE